VEEAMKRSAWPNLGRDFWLYRAGQFISEIGDGCVTVAFAWWILDKTGSAAQMGAIFAPAMAARIFLIPLMGPFGDRYPRKWIAVVADAWRGALFLVVAAMALSGAFVLPAIIAIYVAISVGSALFTSVSGGIVPQLVEKEEIPEAIRQSEAIMAFGGILGGILGGVAVMWVGVGGAFILNAISFFVAGALCLSIKANTRPERRAVHRIEKPLAAWFRELREGFRVVGRIRIVLSIGIVAAMLNLVVAPIGIALPVLVKEAHQMPAWFLGALNSSVSVGIIAGALFVGWLCRRLFPDRVIVAGIVVVGVGLGVLPWIRDPVLPLVAMFCVGVGLMMANLPLCSQSAIAMPDEYRSRTESVLEFISQVANPLGMAVAGGLISGIGIEMTLFATGILLILLSPLLYLIPRFAEFYRLPPKEAGTFFRDSYPEAFAAR